MIFIVGDSKNRASGTRVIDRRRSPRSAMTREKTSTLRSLKPFLLVAKLLGIFGCGIHGERVERGGLFSYFYSALWIAITYYLTPINIRDLFEKDKLIFGLLNVAFFLTVAGDMHNSIFQQRRIIAVFDKMYKYDRRVSNLGFSRQDATIIYWVMGGIPVVMLFCEQMTGVFVDNYKILPFSLRLKFWYYPAMSYSVVMKFCMLVHVIYQRFKYLNENITKRVVDGNGMYNRQSVTIYEIRYLHSTLYEAAGVLMEIYSPWILLWCGVMTTGISKGVGNYIRHKVFDVSILLTVIWMIGLCVSCGVASDEADKIAPKLVENRPLSGNAADTTDRIEMALYLCNHKLRFTAMNMYCVNRSFLLAIISMMLTYMTFTLSK